ncbi:hypothetical protein Hanom_Chr12g01153291 [Helianthus anomalus]
MADQGIPFSSLGFHSHSGPVADNVHIQSHPADEYAKEKYTKVGAMHASGTHTTQNMTPMRHGVGPSTQLSSLLPEGESPTSWFVKQL